MGDVRSVPYTKLLVQSYQLDARLAKLPQFEDQPTPEDWQNAEWRDVVA